MNKDDLRRDRLAELRMRVAEALLRLDEAKRERSRAERTVRMARAEADHWRMRLLEELERGEGS